MGVFDRLGNVIKGAVSARLSNLEKNNPEAVFAAAKEEGINRLKTANDTLSKARHEAEENDAGNPARAAAFRDLVLPAMTAVREQADLLETIVADDLWPLPKYREILFLH